MSINSSIVNSAVVDSPPRRCVDSPSSSTTSISTYTDNSDENNCLFLPLRPSPTSPPQKSQEQHHVEPHANNNSSTVIEISDAATPNISPHLEPCKSSSSLNSTTTSSSGTISSQQVGHAEASSTLAATSFLTFTPQNAEIIKPKRTNKACTACKSAHKKCSNTRPCTRCISLNREDKCVDMDSGRKRGRRANTPRSGGLLVHNYDPHNPFVSGKPNTVVFSLQHAINEDPGSHHKPSKKVKQIPTLHAPDMSNNNNHHAANEPIGHVDVPHATNMLNHTNMLYPTSHHFSTPSHHTDNLSTPYKHASHSTSSTIQTSQKTLPSINELTECKNILSNSQSVFYHQ